MNYFERRQGDGACWDRLCYMSCFQGPLHGCVTHRMQLSSALYHGLRSYISKLLVVDMFWLSAYLFILKLLLTTRSARDILYWMKKSYWFNYLIWNMVVWGEFHCHFIILRSDRIGPFAPICNDLRWFAMACNDLQWFATICNDLHEDSSCGFMRIHRSSWRFVNSWMFDAIIIFMMADVYSHGWYRKPIRHEQ